VYEIGVLPQAFDLHHRFYSFAIQTDRAPFLKTAEGAVDLEGCGTVQPCKIGYGRRLERQEETHEEANQDSGEAP
jgi:hypothetical protein